MTIDLEELERLYNSSFVNFPASANFEGGILQRLHSAFPELIRLARIGKEAEAKIQEAYFEGCSNGWQANDIARGEDE